jgi:hypothetical protein
MFHVEGGCSGRDHQRLGNLSVGQPSGQQGRHLPFATRKSNAVIIREIPRCLVT